MMAYYAELTVMKKASAAERVDVVVCAFMQQVGRNPNKLWISAYDWHELSSSIGGRNSCVVTHPADHNVKYENERFYQGMKVELIAPGAELFVGIDHPVDVPIGTQNVFISEPPAALTPPPAPERKRIIPPSQLKRKLAL